MSKRASIDFISLINEKSADLRFGGEPFGLPVDHWPKSRAKQEAMQFICQIPFDCDLIPGAEKSMAYLSMSHGDVDDKWQPDGGENSVVILPMNKLTNALSVGDAPRLFQMVKPWLGSRLKPKSCTFSAKLTFSKDPDYIPDNVLFKMPDEEVVAYRKAIEGNKLGGTPGFLQADELPYPDKWHLLLQLDSTTVPFWINFGDAGVGYLFLNSTTKEGKFLWQCL